jgi:hypothetical protein
MEAKEPAVVYGTLSAPIEEMQNKVIAAVKEMKDVELLKRCYQLLRGKASSCELDQALEEVRLGNLKSHNSIDELLAELKTQDEVPD